MNRNRSTGSFGGANQQANNFQFGDFKSLKDFKKGKEVPKFKFTSDIVKEILEPKSDMYNSPNVPKEQDTHQKTWKQNMHALQHPSRVKFIKNGIDQVRSQSYNLLQNLRLKAVTEEKAKLVGKEGPETDLNNNQNRMDRSQTDFMLSEAEQEKYLRIQREYLEFFIDMGLPIPKDKNDLFKVLILKDYFSHDDEQKKRQNAIQKLENESKSLQSKLNKIDRRQESKIISQANKNFNIYVHANRLKNEDFEYLKELNDQINLKIKYCTQPSLMHQLMEKIKNRTAAGGLISQDDSQQQDRNDSIMKMDKAQSMAARNQPRQSKVLPSINTRIAQIKASDLEQPFLSPSMRKGQSVATTALKSDIHGAPTSTNTLLNLNPQYSTNYAQYQSSNFGMQNQHQQSEITQTKQTTNSSGQDDPMAQFNEQQKQGTRDYFQKLYRKNKIKRSKAPGVLFKTALLNDQFDFFLKTLREKTSKEQLLLATIDDNSQVISATINNNMTIQSQKTLPYIGDLASPSKDQSPNVSIVDHSQLVKAKPKKPQLSDMFVEQNKFLPEKLFSIKKIKDYSLGLPIEEDLNEMNQSRDEQYFQLSRENMKAFQECQEKLTSMKGDLDEREKGFLLKALRDFNEYK